MGIFIRRLLVCGLFPIFLSLFCIDGKHPKAEDLNVLTDDWIWPTDGKITDVYGTRHGTHKGIDIAAEPQTAIYAVDAGIVSKSYYSDTYGHVIFIKHQNNLETVYAHLSKRNVSEGQSVHQGELIGQMGNTGDSSGVHLHFEVHEEEWTYSKENAIDPEEALGSTKVGQLVYANEKKFEDSIETVGRLSVNQKMATKKYLNNPHHSKKDEYRMHIIQSGETLWSISKTYNTSVERLMEMNRLSDDVIAEGQTLKVGVD
ncbi:peptidoglycan DD-metalloendopeptidase family protein [Bacillus sp. B15-48]|uniref:peptidoglycan DD-metalloendopeptidase family protein n=1 Tax=Bacillus sp. B15-48 TaxID=1548601 RepID=UPI00193F0970|nr:peptidoglycan DD-metalloendopeptidase family protein [Bacillus sp. B15-48]